jgi:4-carboxymuconolactone decarboxylase
MPDEQFERGLKVRREVMGDAYVDRALTSGTPITAEFQELLTRFAWGEVWSRPGLDRKTRSCVTVALLAALGKEQELTAHLKAALNNGVSHEEIKEVLLHVAVYCGIPAANAAFRVAAEVLM